MIDVTSVPRDLGLVNHRPDFDIPKVPPGLREKRITLERLSAEQVQHLVAAVLGERTLPAEVMEQIQHRTDGGAAFCRGDDKVYS